MANVTLSKTLVTVINHPIRFTRTDYDYLGLETLQNRCQENIKGIEKAVLERAIESDVPLYKKWKPKVISHAKIFNWKFVTVMLLSKYDTVLPIKRPSSRLNSSVNVFRLKVSPIVR